MHADAGAYAALALSLQLVLAALLRVPMAVLVEEVTGVRLGPDLSTPATDADRDDAVVALEAAGASSW